MKLIELYSKITGLKTGKQFLLSKFYPLQNHKYITIQSGSGMQGKNYPFFDEVIDIIFPLLKANGIDIVQLGGPEDAPLKNCVNLQGKTDIHQTNYILEHSILHCGNDSWQQHRTGDLNIPTVTVFGPTSIENHSSYHYHPNSQFIEAHRWGKKPTFASQEFPSSIATIRPEEIANGVFKALGLNISFPRESYFIGHSYSQKNIEWVPDEILNSQFISGQAVIARCDYSNDKKFENYLFDALQNRNLFIISDKDINLNIVNQFKNKINLMIFKVNSNTNLEYIKNLKKTGVKLRILTEISDEKELSDLRLKYLDVTQIEHIKFKIKDNFWLESKQYLNFDLDKETALLHDIWVRSNKYILSKGRIYLNKAAFKRNLPTDSFENNIMPLSVFVDDLDFWSELDYYYIFKQKQS